MKKFILGVSIAISALFALPQCDVIDQPFKGGTVDTTSTTQQRNVLIEDWTGHKCKNCPKASKAIQELVDVFGDDRIIGLAIHGRPSSFTGVNSDYPTDFTTPEGKAVQSFFYGNSPPLPIGMLNRENWSTSGFSHLSSHDNWATLSAEAMDSTLQIALEADATVSQNQLTVNASGFPQVPILHDLNIVVLVKESHIVSPQLMPDNTRDTTYEHKNVLRDYVTDVWGEAFGTAPMQPGETISDTYSLPWNSQWVQANCDVVVYVYNPDNYRVLQVIKVPIN
jgi:hypothetical protein